MANPVKKKETFWTSGPLMEKLAEIPEGEKSFVIRTALRQYFGITGASKTPAPITPDMAQLIARELMQNLRRKNPDIPKDVGAQNLPM